MSDIELEGVEYKGFTVASNKYANCDWWECLIIKKGGIVGSTNARTQLQAIELARSCVDRSVFYSREKTV